MRVYPFSFYLCGGYAGMTKKKGDYKGGYPLYSRLEDKNG